MTVSLSRWRRSFTSKIFQHVQQQLAFFDPSTAITGTITAQAISNCGNSSIRTFNLVLPACTAGFAKTVSKTVEAQKTENEKVIVMGMVYANPTDNSFHLQIPAYENSVVEGRIIDLQGKEI